MTKCLIINNNKASIDLSTVAIGGGWHQEKITQAVTEEVQCTYADKIAMPLQADKMQISYLAQRATWSVIQYKLREYNSLVKDKA